MRRTQNPNLEILRIALSKLDKLADEFVFVGGCATGLLIELKNSQPELKRTLALRFRELLEVAAFVQSIPGHLPGDTASQQRVPRLMQLLRETAKLE